MILSARPLPLWPLIRTNGRSLLCVHVERSFLPGAAAGLLRPAPGVALVRLDRPAARPQVQVVGRGDGRAAQAAGLSRIHAGPAVGADGPLLRPRAGRIPVQAGEPNPVEDGHSDALTIDDYLIERPSQTVLIRVKGDSMQDAGILEGDLVVVEKAASAKRGDIVVAIVDSQFTLKRLDVEDGQFVLKPREQGLRGHPSRRHARDLRRDGRARCASSEARGFNASLPQRRSTSTRQS